MYLYRFFVRMFVMTSDNQSFAVYSRSDMSWVKIYDIVVGLCSELLIRLSYYMHRTYGKHFSTHSGIKPRTSWSRAVCLNRSNKVLTCLVYLHNSCFLIPPFESALNRKCDTDWLKLMFSKNKAELVLWMRPRIPFHALFQGWLQKK